MIPFLSFFLKISIGYLILSILLFFLKNSSPAFKRTLLITAMVGYGATVVISYSLPVWQVSLNGPAIQKGDMLPIEPWIQNGDSVQNGVATESGNTMTEALRNLDIWLWSLRLLILFLWLAGCLYHLARIIFENRSYSHLLKSSFPAPPDLMLKIRDSLAGRRRMRQIQILQNPNIKTAMTWGSLKPMILLPEATARWSEDKIRMVLNHELAHIKQLDCFWERSFQIIAAVLWFHPCVWLTIRRFRLERERAADEMVLSGGTKAHQYASHLMAIALDLRKSTSLRIKAIPSLDSTGLRSRLVFILSSRKKRICGVVRAGVTVLLFVLLLNLGAFSLNLGTLPYELSPDSLLYWKKIENKHLSAAYMFEKVLVKKGISRARQKYTSLDSLNSDPYYHDLGEFNALGNRLLESGKLPEALNVFRLNVTAYPDDWRTHNTLAYAQMVACDYKAAIDSCRKILDLNPPYKEKILRIIEELQKELK